MTGFRQTGTEEHPACVIRHLSERLSGLCPDAKHLSGGRAVRLLRVVSGDISRGRQGIRIGLRAGRTARQRRRLVQHDSRAIAACRQYRRRPAVDRIGHVAVFYYGAFSSVVGSVGLLLLVVAQGPQLAKATGAWVRCARRGDVPPKRVGPPGLEPGTKGFVISTRFRAARTISSPAAGAGRVRDALACDEGRCSPQVVSAPSGGAPPAWLRVASGRSRGGFPEFIPIPSAAFATAAPCR